MPSAYRSAAGVAGMPAARSGARYAGVPISVPGLVTDADPAAYAIPKSVIFTFPSLLTSRFPGLMSRCTRPASWAACKAAAAWAIRPIVRAGPSGPSSSSLASDGPSTSSITR